MKREYLRGLGIAEDLIPQIIDTYHDSLRPYREKADSFDAKQAEVDTLKEELKSRDEQIESLKTSAAGNEDLLKEIESYKAQNAEYEGKLKQSQLKAAVIAAAREANDPADVLAFLDTSKLTIEDNGNITGLDEALKGLKETKPYLFQEAKRSGRTPVKGESTDPKVTVEQFKGMSYQEKTALYNSDPELYSQLTEQI